jgi:hypothetical protein
VTNATSEWLTRPIDPGCDAYADWLRGPGGEYPPKYKEKLVRWSVVIRLSPGVTAAQFAAVLQEDQPKGAFRLEIPDFYLRNVELPSTKSQHVFTATVDYDFFDVLASNERARKWADRIVISQVLPHDAICGTGGMSEPSAARAGEGDKADGSVEQVAEAGVVVMGIIDEGIAFGHERFRRSVEDSRVEYAWIQDGQCEVDVQGFHYGRELQKTDRYVNGTLIEGIDTLLKSCTHNGLLDEDLFYRRAGLIDFNRPGHKAAAQRVAHGTHVMDLACGKSESPTFDARPIVCVQLPTATVADTSGLGLQRYMLDAVSYILERAEAIQRDRQCGRLPVVINFSSGILAGPHDGTHPIETALDAIIAGRQPPIDIILPAGNSHLSRVHVRAKLAPSGAGNPVELQWCLLPDDKTCSYLEIWLPRGCPGGVELRVVPPNGETSPPLPNAAGNCLQWSPGGQGLCRVYYEHIADPTNGVRYTIAVLPTAFEDKPFAQLAPSGVWKIQLNNTTDHEIDDVHGWIQWDDRPIGYPQTGRQSFFTDSTYQRFAETSGEEIDEDNNTSVIKRGGAMNAIATGSETIAIGGFYRQELTAAKYSAGGPLPAHCDRVGPDALAVSDTSKVRRFILAAGTRSGSKVGMNGTSVAAPQIAREIAKRRAAGDRRRGRDIVKEIAQKQECKYKDQRPDAPPPERGGWGRIETQEQLSRTEPCPGGTSVEPQSATPRLDGVHQRSFFSIFLRIFSLWSRVVK